jgi:peptidoglycan/LPS O-acetylase OafA/YrhL
MEHHEYDNGAQPLDSTLKDPSDGIIVAYLAGAGIASIVLTLVFQERFARPTFEVLSGFFCAFFALGILLLGWHKRVLKGSILAAAFVLVIAGVFWAFGGKAVDTVLTIMCGLSLVLILYKRFNSKQSQPSKENAERR